MSMNLELTASQEDYLEAIFHIVEKKKAARAKDIVLRLGVHNSSVTQALRVLSERELINYAPYDIITLTDIGEECAREIVRRHSTLREFLLKVLSLDEAAAEESACKMEHAINGPILERLVSYLRFVDECPRAGVSWDEEMGYFCGKCAPSRIPGSCESTVCVRRISS